MEYLIEIKHVERVNADDPMTAADVAMERIRTKLMNNAGIAVSIRRADGVKLEVAEVTQAAMARYGEIAQGTEVPGRITHVGASETFGD